MTLDQNVEAELAEARRSAERGDVLLMNSSLNPVRIHAPAEVADVERLGYEKAVLVKLADARKYAEMGDALLMDPSLNLMRMYAERVGQGIPAEVADVERLGYEKAVPVKLAEARKWAEQGDAPLMEITFEVAQEYAKRTGQDISEQVAETRAGLQK